VATSSNDREVRVLIQFSAIGLGPILRRKTITETPSLRRTCWNCDERRGLQTFAAAAPVAC